jgi:hypothetical protein
MKIPLIQSQKKALLGLRRARIGNDRTGFSSEKTRPLTVGAVELVLSLQGACQLYLPHKLGKKAGSISF